MLPSEQMPERTFSGLTYDLIRGGRMAVCQACRDRMPNANESLYEHAATCPAKGSCDRSDGPHTYVGGPAALAERLRESRDWWRDEADQRSRDYDRDFLIFGICAALIAVAAFWVGVLVGG